MFSLLLNGKDAVTVRALEPCVFRVVQNPREMLKESPLLCWQVCETITRRLSALTAYLTDVQRQLAGSDHLGMLSEVLATLLYRQPVPRIRPRESTIRQGELTE